jgi:hypothetical protein
MKLTGESVDAFSVMNHGFVDCLMNGLLQAWPKISGQSPEDLFSTQMSGFM